MLWQSKSVHGKSRIYSKAIFFNESGEMPLMNINNKTNAKFVIQACTIVWQKQVMDHNLDCLYLICISTANTSDRDLIWKAHLLPARPKQHCNEQDCLQGLKINSEIALLQFCITIKARSQHLVIVTVSDSRFSKCSVSGDYPCSVCCALGAFHYTNGNNIVV